MEVKIKERGSVAYYDEFLYIIFFIKRFIKNPKRRVHRATHYFIILAILILLLLACNIYFYIKYEDGFNTFVVGFLSVLLIYILFYLFTAYKRIKMYLNNQDEITFAIKEEGIIYKSETVNVDLKWEYIKYVVVSDNTIVFIPISIKYLITSISTDYKEQVFKGLKKYKKEDLLVELNRTK